MTTDQESLYAPAVERGYVLVEASDPDDVWTVILDPEALAGERSTPRAALNINTGSIRVSQDGIDWGQSAIDAYEAALGTWGSTVVDRRWPNRTVTINLLVGADDTGEAGFINAAEALRQKVALFQRENGTIQRGSDVPMYAEVVSASLTFADQWGETGFLESNVILTLECLPDFFGDEITLDSIPCTGDCHAVLQQDGEDAIIDGDHPARCRIVVTDSSGHDQEQVVWGFRSRHYDPADTAALFFECEDLTPNASETALHTRTGASGGASNNVYRLTGVDSTWYAALFTDLSGVGALTHEGSYRVLVRVAAPADGSDELQMRLTWGIGDLAHAVTNDQVTVPADDGFYVVNLGAITLQKPPVGDYLWRGIIEAQESGGITLDFDCLWFQPLDESAGVAAATDGFAIVAGGPSVPDEAIYADRTMELRTDGVFREDSTGGPYNPMGIVTGDLPRLPPSGLESRPVELLVKPTRGSIVQGGNASPDPDASASDAFTVQVSLWPSYMFRP